MQNEKFIYSKLTNMSVEMQTQESKNMCLLRGKALLNESECRFTFVQTPPRGPRSVEIGRTCHSRIVRRPDGNYTLTFRFSAEEKFVKESLVSEIREVVSLAKNDKLLQEKVADNKK